MTKDILTDSTIYFIVYEHIFPNNKRYIGITSQEPEVRWKKDGSGYKRNSLMWKAICKYGWDNIVHNILAKNLSQDEANAMEINLIHKYNTTDSNFGYNIMPGGLVASGWHHTEESKKKMSASQKGKPGRPCAHKGEKHGRTKVYQYALTGQLLASFNTYFEASVALNIPEFSIQDCANNHSKTCYGYTFSKIELTVTEVLSKVHQEPGAHRVTFYQYDKNGALVGTYRAYKTAIAATGFSEGSIEECLAGRTKTCHGFVFSYEKLTSAEVLAHYAPKNKRVSNFKFIVIDRFTNISTVYYSVDQVADYLNTNTTTIYNILNGKTTKSKPLEKYIIRRELK